MIKSMVLNSRINLQPSLEIVPPESHTPIFFISHSKIPLKKLKASQWEKCLHYPKVQQKNREHKMRLHKRGHSSLLLIF